MSTNTLQATPRRQVTVIPADPKLTERDIRKKHLRVAAYCRVSTDTEEQLSSYEAQVKYLHELMDSVQAVLNGIMKQIERSAKV